MSSLGSFLSFLPLIMSMILLRMALYTNPPMLLMGMASSARENIRRATSCTISSASLSEVSRILDCTYDLNELYSSLKKVLRLLWFSVWPATQKSFIALFIDRDEGFQIYCNF